ncbi:polymorphic toxin type 15 domain-containing protein [Vannielia litorea]|uniref:polymorphic toxin type 15 domain-containing protein n=1 Tax=Vannielia litorea TaxID=1217970 RepID=UPI001C95CA67|nr:polymorphic toxin type 15 domain-containing protein [Vannielia litorea]MBY6047001.1 hypothetical protein [Vannielia litorea]MBY6074415.1 hypothetical protein [Vannielia litorea]
MAETELEERYLRDQREYEEALQAYRELVGGAANTLPMPSSFEASYLTPPDGYERAATDPWISERFPGVADAAQRVIAEEADLQDADYLALDEPGGSHGQGNCSIAQYTREQFLEYYAMIEMVYKLATDDDFRRKIAGQLHSAYMNSAFRNIEVADILDWRADNLQDDIEAAEARERGDRTLLDRVGSVFGFEDGDEFALWAMGYDSVEEMEEEMGVEVVEQSAAELRERQDRLRAEADIHRDAAIEKLKSYFTNIWNQLKARYEECGLMYAIVTSGIDGAFLAAEFGAGVGIVRALRFVPIQRGGRYGVELTTMDGRRLGEADWSEGELTGKYGEPDQSQVAGIEPDSNRTIPDRDASTGDGDRRDGGEGGGDGRDNDDPATAPVPQTDVPCFDVPDTWDADQIAEFDRQLAEQQTGINSMTADEMGYAHAVLDQARTVWRENGQNGSATDLLRDRRAQEAAREAYRNQLRQQGLSPARIREIMSGLNATHVVDIIAGGDPRVLTMGGGPQNQRIGSLWNIAPGGSNSGTTRAGTLAQAASDMRAAGMGDRNMNVGLSRCR